MARTGRAAACRSRCLSGRLREPGPLRRECRLGLGGILGPPGSPGSFELLSPGGLPTRGAWHERRRVEFATLPLRVGGVAQPSAISPSRRSRRVRSRAAPGRQRPTVPGSCGRALGTFDVGRVERRRLGEQGLLLGLVGDELGVPFGVGGVAAAEEGVLRGAELGPQLRRRRPSRPARRPSTRSSVCGTGRWWRPSRSSRRVTPPRR